MDITPKTRKSVDLPELFPDLKPIKPLKTLWQAIEVRFISGSGYCLGTQAVDALIEGAEGGFRIKLRTPLAYPAAQLMGPKVRRCVLSDVELHFTEIVLSMKDLEPGTYPKVFTEGQKIGLS